MNAAERARELKKTREKQAAREAAADRAIRKEREATRATMVGWIEDALGSFDATVERKWFAGCDYWVLSRKHHELVSCVLEFRRGAYNVSDECAVDYAEWQITVCRGAWGGPSDRACVVMAGITTKESLDEYVARVMEKYV